MKQEVINLRQHLCLFLLPATPSTVGSYWLQESSGDRAIKIDGLNVEVCITVTRLSVPNDSQNMKSILRNIIRNSRSLHFESILFLIFLYCCGFLFLSHSPDPAHSDSTALESQPRG